MHKGVILLTKADTASEAQSNVDNFMEPHGDSRVWDWYVIGGRWSGTLNNKTKEFHEVCDERLPAKNSFGLTTKEVEENMEQYTAIWKEIGGEGKNPYDRDRYRGEGSVDDIIPLENCLDVVKEWEMDREHEANKEYDLLVEAYSLKHDADPSHTKSSAAYHADKFKNWVWDCFSFDSNTYSIDDWTNDVPTEDIEKYWAVMVDMHN